MGRSLSVARRVLGFTVIPAALVATGAFVCTSSYSVFNAETTNEGNVWNTGTLTLTNDVRSGRAPTPLFSANITPGSTVTRCLTVTSTGTLPSNIRLYGSNLTSTNGLSDSLTIGVRMGTATSTDGGVCTGFSSTSVPLSPAHLSAFPTGGYANGLTTWSPTGAEPESRAFEITTTMDSTAPNSTQGGSAHLDFVWEAQTN